MENHTNLIFNELFLSIERVGIEATIRQLKATQRVPKANLEAYIFEMVCTEFGVKKSQLLEASDKDLIKRNARIISSYLIYHYTPLNQRQVGELMDRSKGTINKHITEVENFTPKIKYQKELIAVIGRMETEIKEVKKKSN
tara:strand:+ start:1112 stop:1534 length:423 start_codon:yes stop_codon:yes gene_type:complete